MKKIEISKHRSLVALVVIGLTACGSPEQSESSAYASDSDSAPIETHDGGIVLNAQTSDADAHAPDSAAEASNAQPKASGCITKVAAGHHSFSCDGLTYEVEVPIACAKGGCGAVLDIHGAGMTAADQDMGTHQRALGRKYGYVVVQPQAPGAWPLWDQSKHIPMLYTTMRDIVIAYAIDKKRVHNVGFSMGGGMTWRMLCTHADFFASFALIAAAPGCEFKGTNVPSREVPVLQMHGHKDTLMNFTLVAMSERNDAFRYWQMGDNKKVLERDADYQATTYSTKSGTEYQFWEHHYKARSVITAGHCFPGGSDRGTKWTQFGCEDADAFVAGEKVMRFFIDHPMK